MLDPLDMVSAVLQLFFSWRFYVCLFVSLFLAGIVYYLAMNSPLRVGVAVTILLLGIASGIVWEYRTTHSRFS